MTLQPKSPVPTEPQKLAILRGMLQASTGISQGNRPVLPPSFIPVQDGYRACDDPDEHGIVAQGSGGVWDDDADDDD
jgi:hypothetical protein